MITEWYQAIVIHYVISSYSNLYKGPRVANLFPWLFLGNWYFLYTFSHSHDIWWLGLFASFQWTCWIVSYMTEKKGCFSIFLRTNISIIAKIGKENSWLFVDFHNQNSNNHQFVIFHKLYISHHTYKYNPFNIRSSYTIYST